MNRTAANQCSAACAGA